MVGRVKVKTTENLFYYTIIYKTFVKIYNGGGDKNENRKKYFNSIYFKYNIFNI